jgi:GxxExxY protein
MEVHRQLGPGLLEKAYEEALVWEINSHKLLVLRQVPIPVQYKSKLLDTSFKIDLLVENQLVLELKSVTNLLPVHHAQILTYMKLAHKPAGLILNFNVKMMKQGIKRFLL